MQLMRIGQQKNRTTIWLPGDVVYLIPTTPANCTKCEDFTRLESVFMYSTGVRVEYGTVPDTLYSTKYWSFVVVLQPKLHQYGVIFFLHFYHRCRF